MKAAAASAEQKEAQLAAEKSHLKKLGKLTTGKGAALMNLSDEIEEENVLAPVKFTKIEKRKAQRHLEAQRRQLRIQKKELRSQLSIRLFVQMQNRKKMSVRFG